ncbi:MAG: hypothetical protein ACREVZ_17045, partial [Burkholderiales bacterium]
MTQTPYELAVERYIDAPPTTVFKEWTEPLEDRWAPKPQTPFMVGIFTFTPEGSGTRYRACAPLGRSGNEAARSDGLRQRLGTGCGSTHRNRRVDGARRLTR